MDPFELVRNKDGEWVCRGGWWADVVFLTTCIVVAFVLWILEICHIRWFDRWLDRWCYGGTGLNGDFTKEEVEEGIKRQNNASH